jgi:O-antigen ligase
MNRRIAAALAALIVLVAPLGEGGRAPDVLFTLHTLTLLCLVLVWSGSPGPRRPATDLLREPWVLLVAVAIAGVSLAVVSALRASYPLAAALGTLDLVVPLALFMTAAGTGTTEQDLVRLRATVVASTALQATLALVRWAQGGSVAASQSFLNRSHLAAFLVAGFCLALVAACAPVAPRRARAVWSAVAGLHVLGVFVLESRGAFAAVLAALLVFGALRFSRLSPRGRVMAIGAMLACVLAAWAVLSARFSRAPDPYRYSRLAIWRASGEMIAERPLLGFGPGMFPHVSPRFNFPIEIGPVRYGRGFQGAHSGYLTLAAETGIPAALLILAALAGAIVLLLRSRSDPQGLVHGTGLMLLALLAQGAVEDLQVRPALTIVPALLAGAAAAALRRGRLPSAFAGEVIEVQNARRGGLLGRVVGVTCAAYVFIFACLRPYLADREAAAAMRSGSSGVAHMERAIRLNPLHPEFRNSLAMAILNSGPLSPDGYSRAATNLLEARRLKPIDYRFPLHLARLEERFATRLFDDASAQERAVSLYREAVRLAPLDPRPRLELAGHLLDLKRPSEALQAVREALVLEPSFVRARLLEASILLDIGRPPEARDSLRLAESTLRSLSGYVADSGYAAEIVKDARVERERLATVLRGGSLPGEHS